MRKVFALPKESKAILGICILIQLAAVWTVAQHPAASFMMSVAAFFLATYLSDMVTAFFHFGFDYVWPDRTPIMGPISVEFRAHHDRPKLDPSALVSNLTRGAYMGIPFALLAMWISHRSEPGSFNFLCATTLLGISLWGLGFHQIHSYAHMGKYVSPEEFNSTVARISKMSKAKQRREFAKLFARVGIPKPVRVLQRMRLFLRPEVHWQHHNSFESDFSSLNGWSDPLTNLFFGPIARARKNQREKIAAVVPKRRLVRATRKTRKASVRIA